MTDPAGPRALRILHLSDTHLFGDDTRHYGVVDTTAALRRVLNRCVGMRRVDVVVASGDLSDDGSEASYRLLRDELEAWAGARGAVVLYTMGNHDRRDGFEAVIGDRVRAVTVGDVRFLLLDSSVPGRGHGRVDTEQLDWLRGELATPAAGGSVVVVHHPPVPALTPLLHALELQNPDDLLDACAGTDVRVILSGHYHHSLVARRRGIPVIVAPGVANTSDVVADDGRERAAVGSGGALISLPAGRGAPGVTFLQAPSPADGRVLFDLSPADIDAIAAKAGPSR